MLSGGETHVHAGLPMNAEADQMGSDSDYLRSDFGIEITLCGILLKKKGELVWLGGRDSNPDNVVQSHVSYR